ncbi:MAG: winged helix-turn-helix domain-containing protein [Chloroflexota bacterium]
MDRLNLPFRSLMQQVLRDLAGGRCASVVGLSNIGKSFLLRSLAGEEAALVFQELAGRRGLLVYVDCNQAVAASPQAFYEVVLRSALEAIAAAAPDLTVPLQEHHEAVTDAESAFSASLAFNLALIEVCERLGQALCLLIDEFDEIYIGLDERALLNLRALRDRFQEALVFVTATLRSLPELRGGATEDEFAEMFGTSTYRMPALTPEEMDGFLGRVGAAPLAKETHDLCYRLSGGHPGLMVGLAQALGRMPASREPELAHALTQEPSVRAECLKLWTQLKPEEQADMLALALERESGARLPQLKRLEDLGVVREGRVFSPLFGEFVRRRSRAAEVATEGIYLDPDSGDVWVDGARIPLLTDLEYRLLQLLYERRDKLTDKYRIVTAVWGEQYLGDVDDARVEKLVSRLRAQIEPDPVNPRYLITQRGRGYKLLSHPRLAATPTDSVS